MGEERRVLKSKFLANCYHGTNEELSLLLGTDPLHSIITTDDYSVEDVISCKQTDSLHDKLDIIASKTLQ